jgi:ankyrin repeat protein
VLGRSDNSRYSSCDLESNWEPLHFAAVSFSKDSSSSSMETIDALIAAGASLDSTTTAGATPLWLGVRCCTATTGSAAARVEALLQRGADLKCTVDNHGGLLHAAACSGNTAVMQLLLHKGLVLADAEPKKHRYSSFCYTAHKRVLKPLALAAAAGHAAMVQLLIEQRVGEPTTDDLDDAVVRCLAAPADGAACLKVMLDAGSNVQQQLSVAR